MRLRLVVAIGLAWVAVLCPVPSAAAATSITEAIVVVVADQHSAYERTAQLIARMDRLRAENPGVPVAICVNGDSLEHGNVVARRTSGAIDFAMFAAMAERAPTIVNLGNHEPEFYDVRETVARLERTGVTVISGNLREAVTGMNYAAPMTRLKLGAHEAVVVGVTTDRLATYRVAIRPQLDLAEPVAWARIHFPRKLSTDTTDAAGPALLRVVLSHAGLRADRQMLPLVPDGTLFAGAHDHLRLIHREGDTVYFHSGSWMEFMSVARLERVSGKLRWAVEHVALHESDPAEPKLAALIRETLAQHLTAEETAVVGRSARALSPSEAARFAVEAARVAADAEVALIGATTFGAGLPSGDVSRFALDACVRFDGPLHVAEIDGAQLQRILARANQGPETPFAQRGGENLVAVAPASLSPGRRYRFVTTDWVARNAQTYLGDNPPTLKERLDLKLKAAVIAALNAPKERK